MSYKKINIAILGSTGSIGCSSIQIIKEKLNLFNIEILCCDKNLSELSNQIKTLNPKNVVINNHAFFLKAQKKYSNTKINFFNSFDNLKIKKKLDITICAISGIAGLQSTFLFLKFSKKLLIANKESIVCGGQILIKEAKRNNCKIVSIDSEIYSLSLLLKNHDIKNIKSIFITASGGPFFKKKKLASVSVLDALKHPTWKMGKKISIDSATMANKVLEMLEVVTLYNFPKNKLKVKIHPQSQIHAFCILKNGIIDFIGHNTDMKIPIGNAIYNNSNWHYSKTNFMENVNKINLTFYDSLIKKFPLLKLGYKILKLGNVSYILFNVFNDFFVNQFLHKKISFADVTKNIITLFNNKKIIMYCNNKKIKKYSDIAEVINYSRRICLNLKKY